MNDNNREENGFEAYIEREFIDNTEEFELPAERKKSFRIAFAYAFALVMVLIVFGVTGTYAYYNVEIQNDSETTALKASVACFNVVLSETSQLSLGNYNYPIMDDFAKQNGKLTPTKVKIKNSCTSGDAISYSLYLSTTNSNGIPNDKVKVRILKGDNAVSEVWDTKLISTITAASSVPDALKNEVNNKDAAFQTGEHRLIETNSIAANSEVEYSVYLWIDYDATKDEVQGKEFKSLVSAVIN